MVSSDITNRPSRLAALESEVHVWLARPGHVADAACRAGCLGMLDDDERARYRRFHFEGDRDLFLVAHALVRRCLSLYADVDTSAWRFTRRLHGRPEIEAPAFPPGLRFNLSHTPGLAACVVTRESDCGIDVERIVDRHNMPGIAGRIFAGPEQRDLQAREGGADYTDRFMTYWTLREAWCKARGTGLARIGRNVWFETDADDVVTMHGAHGPGEAAERWQCVVLRPTTEHRLAVVVSRKAGVDRPVVCRFIEADGLPAPPDPPGSARGPV